MGLNREVKTQENSSQEALRAQEVRGPGFCSRLCPATGGLGTCHVPSGSPSKEGNRMHDPQHWDLVTFLLNQY